MRDQGKAAQLLCGLQELLWACSQPAGWLQLGSWYRKNTSGPSSLLQGARGNSLKGPPGCGPCWGHASWEGLRGLKETGGEEKYFGEGEGKIRQEKELEALIGVVQGREAGAESRELGWGL